MIQIISCLCALFGLLIWVGWRFFLAHQQSHQPIRIKISTLKIPTLKIPKLKKPTLKKLTHWTLWFAPLLVMLIVVGVLGVSHRILLDPLQLSDFNRQQHIQLALSPEKLVPPPVLPPSLFINTERPALETADREWSRLHPQFMQLVLQVFAKLKERGYPFALLEGYRSPERQDMLAGLGGHVTNARAFQSKHQFGLAIDAAPLREGKLVISERDPWAMQAYQAYGEEAEKAGLVWGGRWKLQDYGHTEAAISIAAYLKKK